MENRIRSQTKIHFFAVFTIFKSFFALTVYGRAISSTTQDDHPIKKIQIDFKLIGHVAKQLDNIIAFMSREKHTLSSCLCDTLTKITKINRVRYSAYREIRLYLGKRSKMIILGSLLKRFLGSQGSSQIWLELKIKPQLQIKLV